MRTITGIVTSKKMDKTLVLTVHSYRNHPKYKKRYRVSKKFYVHNPENKYEVGEEITVYESKPLSKLKRWSVAKPEVTKN
jgi:small subunit ribosomal protein S17